MNKKTHTRNQRRMYRIKKLEERRIDLENMVMSLLKENKNLKTVICEIEELIYETRISGEHYVETKEIGKLLDLIKEYEEK